MTSRLEYQCSGLEPSPEVAEMTLAAGRTLLDKHHYLGGLRTATLTIGHAEGCTVWGVMRSRGWHSNLVTAGFNPIELVRMVGVPQHRWATSSLLAKSVRWLFDNRGFDALVTYADPMYGHTGNTYRAANWQSLPQDSQPDGFVWRLDGSIVSRKRFYAELGTSALPEVRRAYGDRITLEKDAPKKRLFILRDMRRVGDFLAASRKVKTWGVARSRALEAMKRRKA